VAEGIDRLFREFGIVDGKKEFHFDDLEPRGRESLLRTQIRSLLKDGE
jgi:hypothetical protein